MSSYSAFEVKEGGVLERVEAICRHLTSGGSFTDTTPVKLVDVELFIDDGYIFLVGELAKNGYATTVTVDNVKKVLQLIQAVDAAVSVELAMPANDDGEENGRWKGLVARRDKLIKDYLQTDALEQLGATRARNKSAYLDATGRSVDRKNTVYDDTDIVPGRFPRGFGQRRDTPNRSGRNTNDVD